MPMTKNKIMKYGLEFLRVSFVNIPSLTEIIVKIGT